MRGWLLVLAGCTGPEDPGPGAIEITGYLDASRVAWTWTGAEVLAAGLEGAASPGSVVELVHGASGARAEGVVGEEGEFSLALAAAIGDQVVLTVAGAAEEEHHDVVEPAPFPEHSHISALVDLHAEDTVAVEVQLEPARDDGQLWVVNPQRDGTVATLEVHQQGAIHAGTLPGLEGDALLLWFVPEAGLESAPVEVIVGPAQ